MSTEMACNSLQTLLSMADQLFSASAENIAIYDTDGTLVYCNPVLLSLFDETTWHTAEAPSGKQLKPEQAESKLRKVIQNVVAQGKADTFLYHAPELVHDTRRLICDLIYLHPIRNDAGEVIAVLGFCRLLDSLQAPEQALLTQQHLFMRALLDSFPFIVWMKDRQGRYLEVNKPLVALLGKQDFDEVYGKTDHDFFPPEMADGFCQTDIAVLKSGSSITLDEAIRKADGTEYAAITYKVPVKIDDEVIGTVGFASDVSQIRALERLVARRHAEYQSLIEHLPVMIFKYDLNCKRVYANASAFQSAADLQGYVSLGVTPAESWSPAITNMTGEEFTQKIRRVIDTGKHETCEIHTNDQSEMPICSVKIVPEFDEKNTIIGAITLVQNISETIEYRKRIEFLAYYDSLTELPNRTHFREVLQKSLDQCRQSTSKLSVMIIDLDHFKNINDALGHIVGDEVLMAVAKRLKNVTASLSNVHVARLGGDEFSVFCLHAAGQENLASELAEGIIQTLSQPIITEDKQLFVGASIGISCYPNHADTVGDLLKYADTAMYLAKHQGRNNYQHFQPEINNTVNYAHQVRSRLSTAMAAQQLYLHYQPIYALTTGKLVKFEALLRWHDPQLGQVEPDKFIAIAEEYGLITRIGDWVLREVCQAAVAFNQRRAVPVRFSINLSPRQFLRGHIEKTVTDSLQETGCYPALLEFEITERLLMDQSAGVLNTLQQWVSMGINIAIDDFGTGYSSLSYLNKFPISNIKIDKSFVHDICHDAKDATLIKAMIQMGLGLEKTLTAEGIETPAQMALLQSWGCQLGQGYLLGRPQPISAYTNL